MLRRIARAGVQLGTATDALTAEMLAIPVKVSDSGKDRTTMHITDNEYTIAALSQAIAERLPPETVWMAYALADNGQQFDTAVSASIRLSELVLAQT